MNGKNMGSLEFFVQETNNQYTVYPPKKNGHQGKGWHHIQFSLRSPSYKKFSYRVNEFLLVCFIIYDAEVSNFLQQAKIKSNNFEKRSNR